MQSYKIVLWYWLMILPFAAFSQSNPSSLKLLAKSRGNEIILRWAPTTPQLWQQGNTLGYILERYTLLPDGKIAEPLGKGKQLSSLPIKPHSNEAFDALAKTEERAGVVQEMIYQPPASTKGKQDNMAAIIQKNKDLENRFGFALLMCDLSAPTAIAAGLMWVDKTIVPDARYIYRLRLADASQTDPMEAVVVVDVTAEKKLSPPAKVTATFTDKSVTLKWPIFLHKGIYTAYQIEKSTDGKNFTSVSDLPFVYFSEKSDPEYAYYVDSLISNEQTYSYRIKGLSPFGETSLPSVVVSGKGQEDFTGLAVIEKAQVSNNKEVLLCWKFPQERTHQIKGFYVRRSTHPDGPYQPVNTKLLPPNKTQYTDLPTATNTYYQISVIGLDGAERAVSFPYLVQLEDHTPPAVPITMTGKIDAKGIATLTWPANKENDLLGYRIFKSNKADEEFIEVTQRILNTPLFTDTVNLQTLTGQVFYKVIAVDKNYNTSPYSAALELQRPDIIPPAPAIFSRAERQGETIELNWIPSVSEDAVRYELYRQENDNATAVRLSEWFQPTNKTSFVDAHATLGKTYQYVLKVYDKAENVSKTVSKGVWFETGVRKPVSQLTGVVDREKKRVVVAWEYPAMDVSQCMIYRSNAGQPFRLYQTLVGNPGTFEDKDLLMNSTYQYKIKLCTKTGIQSTLSEPVVITY